MTELASESEIQSTFVAWLRANEAKEPRLALMFAIPNGGRRSPKTAKTLKAEGVKAGVWDMFLPVAARGYHGLWIEFKKPTGRFSNAQVEWGCLALGNGYEVADCRSVDDAIHKVKWYLGME
jgi:hypothetical protein